MSPTRRKRHTTTIQIPQSAADPWGAQLGEFKESAYRDSSNWNSLLRWHRRNRGPQWDYSTAMYHVDVGSKEFFAGVEPAEPVKEPEPAPAPAAVKVETDKLDSPERPTTATRGPQQQAQNRPSSSSSTSANNPGHLAGPALPTNFPPMPASSLSASNNASAPNAQPKSTPYQQQPQQYTAPAAASPSAEMRQHYGAMFHANRQRAASQQAQAQQQQFSHQGSAGSPPHQRIPSGPAYSPAAGVPQQQQPFFQPGQQAMYQQMQQMANQQMFRPPQQPQQQQQIDPRALFQQPQ